MTPEPHIWEWDWVDYRESKERIRCTCVYCGRTYETFRHWVGDGFAPEKIIVGPCPARELAP